MNRPLALFVFLVIGLNTSAQTDKADNFPLFRREVKSFIDSAKSKSMWHGEHNVYIVDMHNQAIDSNSFCFSVWFIMLAHEYSYGLTNSQYMFTTESEIILINATGNLIRKWKNNNYISSIDSKKFEGRLYHGAGIITHYGLGDAIGLLCWYDGNRIRKKYFKRAEDIDWLIKNQAIPDIFNRDTIPAMKTVLVPALPKIKE